MKKIFFSFVSIVLICFISLPCLAKKEEGFSLPTKKELKTKNLKILSQKWSASLKSGSPAKRYYPETNNPVYEDGIIYTGTHAGHFYAIKSANGKILWEFENDEGIASAAGLSNSKIVFSDFGGKLTCLDKSTGKKIWQRKMNTEILGKPLLKNGKIYLALGEKAIVALSETDGHQIWNQKINTYVKKLTMRGHSDIVSEGGSLYVGLSDGHLYKLNAANGKILWNKNLAIPLSTFKDIDAHVVLSSDSLYVGGYSGALYRIKKSSGQIVWTADVATGVPVLVLDDFVVASDTNGTLYGIDKATGKQAWFNQLNRAVLSEPVLYKNYVFVSSFDKNAFLINPKTGYQVQKISIAKGSINRPLLSNNAIYILTNGAKLLSFAKK